MCIVSWYNLMPSAPMYFVTHYCREEIWSQVYFSSTVGICFFLLNWKILILSVFFISCLWFTYFIRIYTYILSKKLYFKCNKPFLISEMLSLNYVFPVYSSDTLLGATTISNNYLVMLNPLSYIYVCACVCILHIQMSTYIYISSNVWDI